MDDVKSISSPVVSVKVFWERLVPLVVVGFQLAALFVLVFAAIAAFAWFRLPYTGFFVNPNMVVGNLQAPHFDWEQQTYLDEISAGDLLMAIDGNAMQSAADLQAFLIQHQPGDQVELSLRARSGHLTTQTVTLKSFSGYEQMMYFYLPVGVALVFWGVGLWTVRMRLEDPAARIFGLLATAVAVVLIGWFDVWTTHRLVEVWLVAVGVSGGAMIHFMFIYPRTAAWVRRYPVLSWLGYLVGIGLSVVSIMALRQKDDPFKFGQTWQTLIGFGLISLVAFFALMVVRRFISPSPVEVEQTRLVLYGSGIAALPMAVYFFSHVFHVNFLQFPFWIGFIPAVSFPISVGYSILRYRVVNTNYLMSRVLTYALLTVLAGAGYAFLVSGLSVVFSDIIPTNRPILIGMLVFVLALMINPFRNQVQLLLDGIFYRGEAVYQQTIETFADDLTQQVELASITGLLRQTIRTHLDPIRMHIYVYDNLVDRYVPTLGEDGRPTTDIRFPQHSGLVHRLSHQRTTYYLDAREPLPTELEHERARLALLGAQLFLALPGQERLSGWLALGPRNSGERYTAQDMEFLSRVANHAAKAIERAQVMVDKDRRVHEMNVLTRVAQGVNITVMFDDILELLYAQTSQVIPFDVFNLTLYYQPTNTLRHAFLVEKDERITDKENEVIPLGYGLAREVLQNRRAIIADDYQQECRNRRVIPVEQGVYAWMGVPLNAGAEVIGVVSVGSDNPAILYTDDQHNLLQAIADQAAGAIVKSRLLEESQTRARQLATLNDVTRSLTSTLDLDMLLQNITNSAVEILNCEAGSLLLVDEATNELVFEVVTGPVADQLLGERQVIGVGLSGKVAESKSPMIVNNVGESPDWYSEPDEETGFSTRGMLVVPMHYQDKVIGVLEVINKKNGMPFTVDDQELLIAFAGQAAVAVENVRLYMQTDQELANRVEELSVMQRLDRELNTSLDIGKAMEITLSWAMRQSQSHAGLVGVLEEDGLRVMASEGFDQPLTEYLDDVLPLTMMGLAEVVETGQLFRSDRSDALFSPLLKDASSQLVVPIRRETNVIGVILLEGEGEVHYDENTLDFLNRLCDHASIAISNAQLYTEVQRANVAKSDFVSFVSHELKTPMTSIRGYADLLAAGSVGEINEAQSDFLATIRANITRMATLVSDLADISRIEAGRLHLEFAPVSLQEVTDEVVRSTRALSDEKAHIIEVDVPESLAPVWGDRNRLVQILTNLASNAIKYTPNEGRIIIKARQSENQWDAEGSPQVVLVQVVDNGIGIKLEDQAKIFQQYFRTDEGKDFASGTGLGLNITRYLVEMQGGKIWFESEFGAGTTFQFTVPVAEEEGA